MSIKSLVMLPEYAFCTLKHIYLKPVFWKNPAIHKFLYLYTLRKCFFSTIDIKQTKYYIW